MEEEEEFDLGPEPVSPGLVRAVEVLRAAGFVTVGCREAGAGDDELATVVSLDIDASLRHNGLSQRTAHDLQELLVRHGLGEGVHVQVSYATDGGGVLAYCWGPGLIEKVLAS